MRTRLVGLALALSLLSSVASAQDHTDVVAFQKSIAMARGVDLQGSCGAFAITKRVAWALRAEGVGLVSKPSGNNCEGYSVDVLMNQRGQSWDILVASGEQNAPAWNQLSPTDTPSSDRWREPFDPGDAAPPVIVPPAPTPVPAPVPSLDYTSVLERIIDHQREQLMILNETLTVSKDTNVRVQSMDRTLTQTLGSFSKFVGKYIAPAIGGYFIARQLDNPAAETAK